MIVIIAVLAILLLIACVGWWTCYRSKQLVVAVSKFERNASNELQCWLHKEQLKVEALQAELEEIQKPKAEVKEEPEEGGFVRKRKLKRATPETFRNVFDLDINGRRALDHLQLTFAEKSTYVRGGHDAERESCFRAGQVDVISFIFKQINIANDPSYDPKKYEDEVDD